MLRRKAATIEEWLLIPGNQIEVLPFGASSTDKPVGKIQFGDGIAINPKKKPLKCLVPSAPTKEPS